MAKVVRAKRNFEVDRQPDRISVTYMSVHRGRFAIMVVLMLGVMIVAFASGAAVFISAMESDGSVFRTSIIIFLISVATLYFGVKWGYRKTPNIVLIDPEGVTKGDRKYLFSDIDDIGWHFGQDGTSVALSNIQAAAFDMRNAISGTVYLTYGNKTVTLIAGLSEREAERAFDVIHEAMNEMARAFVEPGVASGSQLA